MRGDFSRWTHDPKKRYSAVLKQQGRVDSEADWNEQQAIDSYGTETRTADLAGRCGAPADVAGFEIVASNRDLRIGAGRYYVDGILCENEPGAEVLYSGQPDLPDPPEIPEGISVIYLDVWQHHVIAIDDARIREPALGGPDTATRLRTAWQVKALPLDVEPPLGDEALADLRRPGRIESRMEWGRLVRRSPGRIVAQTETPPRPDPCAVPATAGYRGLENQLYRVEIHQFDTRLKTFKWSRDNGSVVAEWIGQRGDELEVATVGRDRVLGFAAGQWIELTDETRELGGRPGTFVPILRVDGNFLTINSAQAIPTGPIDRDDFPRHSKVRRWDSPGALAIPSVASNQWVHLEDGIQVQFRDGAAGTYRTGDYWFIPARTATGQQGTGDIEWPRTGTPLVPVPQQPHGIVHHYCCLALIQKGEDGTVEVLDDCRELFPPLTGLTSLFYVSGDGQEGPAGEELPMALRAGVANGPITVAGAFVRFRVRPESAGGGLRDGASSPGPGASIDVPTDEEGIAQCFWRLSDAQGIQSVEAILLDAADDKTHLPIRFTAHSLPSLFYGGGDGQDGLPNLVLPRPLEVAVAIRDRPVAGAVVRFTLDPATVGGGISDTATGAPGPSLDVSTEADGIARCYWHLGPSAPLPVVVAQLLGSDGEPVHVPVRFGANLRVAGQISYDPSDCPPLRERGVDTVQAAIDVLCQGAEMPGFVVDQLLFGDGTELRNDTPYPIQQLAKGVVAVCDAPVAPQAILDKPVCIITIEWPYTTSVGVIGFQPIVLAATLRVDGNRIFWAPSDLVKRWLVEDPLDDINLPRALVRLTLKGNFIWKSDDPETALDGEVYGLPGEPRNGIVRTDLRRERGDGRRGGDFEMWFWLIRSKPGLEVPDPVDFGTVPILRATERIVPIRNTGTGPLVVSGLSVTDIRFNRSPIGLVVTPPVEIRTDIPLTVPPQERTDVRIAFILPAPGMYSANLRIESNDPQRPEAVVALTARGA